MAGDSNVPSSAESRGVARLVMGAGVVLVQFHQISLQSALSITFVAGTIARDSAKGCSKSAIGDCGSLIHEVENVRVTGLPCARQAPKIRNTHGNRRLAISDEHHAFWTRLRMGVTTSRSAIEREACKPGVQRDRLVASAFDFIQPLTSVRYGPGIDQPADAPPQPFRRRLPL